MSEFYGELDNVLSNKTEVNKEGMKLPEVLFKTRVRVESDNKNPFEWKDLYTSDYFKGKKCVLFALPGAFTPTCSSSHLPGYEESYEIFKKLGVDEVYCLSVNDAFVMRKWGIDQGLEEDMTPGSLGFKNVKLIPDGACQFTRGMGMSCTWGSERGFGERSWRYSCYVVDGVVKKMFVEKPMMQNSEADPFEVSDANTMLEYLKNEVVQHLTQQMAQLE
jgi:peroxiredoxin